MKVMCIKNGLWVDFKTGLPESGPEYGEIVNASQCSIYSDSYDIAEYPNGADGNPTSWLKRHFIPVSTIDETTFERNYKKELI